MDKIESYKSSKPKWKKFRKKGKFISPFLALFIKKFSKGQ